MFTLSSLDEQRFSVRTGKVQIGPEFTVAQALDHCRAASVEFAIARCSTTDLLAAQQLEASGFFLTDSLVYFERKDLSSLVAAMPPGYLEAVATRADAADVANVATEAFRGYMGHYHADPRLDRAQCDEVYRSWAYNVCSNGSHVIVVRDVQRDQLVGFISVRRNDEHQCEVVLNAVHPVHKGRGLYNALLQRVIQWGNENRFERLLISTQVTNVRVQQIWCRNGLVPVRSFYTFHKWFV
jgi:GNAT superfamily N-acetyltransferase